MNKAIYEIPLELVDAIREKNCIVIYGEKLLPELLRKETILSKVLELYAITPPCDLNYYETMELLKERIDLKECLPSILAPYRKLEDSIQTNEKYRGYLERMRKIDFKYYLSTAWVESGLVSSEILRKSSDTDMSFFKIFGTFSEPLIGKINTDRITEVIDNDSKILLIGFDLKDSDLALIGEELSIRKQNSDNVYFYINNYTLEAECIVKSVYGWIPVYNVSAEESISEFFDYIIEQSPEIITPEERIIRIYDAVSRFAAIAKSNDIIRNAANFGALATPFDSANKRFFDSGEQSVYEEKASYEWMTALGKRGVTARCMIGLNDELVNARYSSNMKKKERLKTLLDNIKKYENKIEILDAGQIDCKIDIYATYEAIQTKECENKDKIEITHSHVFPNVQKVIEEYDKKFEKHKEKVLCDAFNSGMSYRNRILTTIVMDKLNTLINKYSELDTDEIVLKQIEILDKYSTLKGLVNFYVKRLDCVENIKSVVGSIEKLLKCIECPEYEKVRQDEFRKIKDGVEQYTIDYENNNKDASFIIKKIEDFIKRLDSNKFSSGICHNERFRSAENIDVEEVLSNWVSLDQKVKMLLVSNYNRQQQEYILDKKAEEFLNEIFALDSLSIENLSQYENKDFLRYLKKMTRLYLRGISEIDLEEVLEIVGRKKLTTLYVNNRDCVEGHNIRSLTKVLDCVNLKELFFIGTGLTDIDGIERLKDNLRVLNISGNTINDIGALANLGALEQLSIRTVKGVELEKRDVLSKLSKLEFLITSNESRDLTKVFIGKTKIAEKLKTIHLKEFDYCFSHLSIDPIYGCPYDCAYCLWKPYNLTGIKPKQNLEVRKAIEILKSNMKIYDLNQFRNGENLNNNIPVSIGNTCDICHSENQNYLIEFLKEYRKENICNPIFLSTKVVLKDEFLKVLDEFNIPIILAISTSVFTNWREIEGRTPDPYERIEAFSCIDKYKNLHGIHRWRPIFDDRDDYKNILDLLKKYKCEASVINGLAAGSSLINYFNSEISNPFHSIFEKKRTQFRDDYYLPNDYLNKIVDYSREIEYPVFYRQTSCCISYVLRTYDYFSSFSNEFKCNCEKSNCPEEQKERCERYKKENEEIPKEEICRKISHYLGIQRAKVKYNSSNDYLFVDDTISLQKQTYLSHASGFLVRAKKIETDNEWIGSHKGKSVR